MRRLAIFACLALSLAACKKKEAAAPFAAPSPAPAAATASSAAPPAATAAEPSLISFSAGALIVQKPPAYGYGWEAIWLLDERPDSGWASPENNVAPQTMVIALPEKTQLNRLAFDTAAIDREGRGAKDVVVEMSDESATAGFQKIAQVSLQDKADNQTFPVSAQVPGRWLRVTMQNNHGATDYVELMDIRGYGKQLTQTPMPNVSGTYSSNYHNVHLQQDGTSVTGCYETNSGLLAGGIEGHVLKLTWREEAGGDTGTAIMVFTPDTKQLFGLVWRSTETNSRGTEWNGERIANEAGSCPNWTPKNGAAEQMAGDIAKTGRTRVYGINFDTDSDAIKPESKPTLDKIVAMLKTNADWKLKIEGHTDNTGGDTHNQQLSEKRAAAVKTWLVSAGIDGGRLTTQGFGASQPVATNDTPVGKAQNRRVELAKE